MAQFSDRLVFIIGQYFNNYCHTCRAIAFIGMCFLVLARELASALFDSMRNLSTARSALKKAFSHKKGLIYLFERLAILTNDRGQGLQADRTAGKFGYQHGKQRIIKRSQPILANA